MKSRDNRIHKGTNSSTRQRKTPFWLILHFLKSYRFLPGLLTELEPGGDALPRVHLSSGEAATQRGPTRFMGSPLFLSDLLTGLEPKWEGRHAAVPNIWDRNMRSLPRFMGRVRERSSVPNI